MTTGPNVVQQAIRVAWEKDAQRMGLLPVAAFWRWLALERKHPVFWPRKPWKDPAQ